MVRHLIHYTGRVQGVGFRATCRAIASDHEVAGTVRNLPDGRVELIAQGEADQVNAYRAAVRDRLGMFIHDENARDVAVGELTGFRIVR
jgi:acylphosphatase